MAARVEGCLPESGRVPSQDVERRPTHQLLEVVLRGIAETMLPDGTRRLTIYDYQDPAVGDLSEAAERRFQRTAQLIGLEVRHVRCVETLYRSGRVIGATFEAEVWRPL